MIKEDNVDVLNLWIEGACAFGHCHVEKLAGRLKVLVGKTFGNKRCFYLDQNMFHGTFVVNGHFGLKVSVFMRTFLKGSCRREVLRQLVLVS